MRQMAIWIGLGVLFCLPVQADTLTTSADLFSTDVSAPGGVVEVADTDTISAAGNVVSTLSDGYGDVFAGAFANLGLNGVTGAVEARGMFWAGNQYNFARGAVEYTTYAPSDGYYAFAVSIPEVVLEIWGAGSGPSGIYPDYPSAYYEVGLSVRGARVWGGGTELRSQYTGPRILKTGTDLGGTLTADPGNLLFTYEVAPYVSSVNLGFLNAGDEVRYLFWAQFATPGYEMSGSALIGDPSQLVGRSALIDVGAPGNPIPEPSSLLLVAAGVGLLAWLKRRR